MATSTTTTSRPGPWETHLRAVVGALSRGQVWALTLAFTLTVMAGDLLTGADVAFTSLYFLPIGFGGWLAGRRLAELVALLATLTGLLVDLTAHAGRAAPLHVWNFACHAGVFFAFAAVMPRLRAALRTERGRALTDGLTGLPSRAAFFQQADREVLRARRDGRPLSVMYLDLEALQTLNDARGWEAGDAALQAVGAVLQAELRAVDVRGRLGSDEFAVMLPDTALGAAQAVASRLRGGVLARGRALGLTVSVSVGVACYIGPLESTEVLVAAADARRCLDRQGGGARAPAQELHRN